MFFVLSKILYFLIVPITWVLLLLLWIWRTKNQKLKKRLTVVVITVVVVFTNPFLHRSVVLWWQAPRVRIADGNVYDAGIILGGLSGIDKYNHGYIGNNGDRFIQTANLYHRGIIKKIIISGGNGTLDKEVPPEALFLREQFIENGVHDSAIILETRSRNTYENAVFSKQVSDSMHFKQPLVLVTSAFHMPRSMRCFKKAGLDCIAYPCDYKVVAQKPTLQNTLLPDITLLYEWTTMMKEFVGINVYRLTGKA
ncbi:YdcF family protein [Sediminibacterium roseum]|uniref:YdcF family protein n=1 Tax=Sediminibacterium roseum TaxID=1978412 RepID=A0ABW9ZVR3_9BACT|nr:YdcF family protein [Sediminibacterium roseum]NCI51239.1 YdcF family protein [Sediminibacterium roseum]